jgi:carbamoyltransferase
MTHMTGAEYDVPVNINKAGLRMDREIALARTPGVPRVLFLGDSFTFGHAVEARQRFTDLIQRDWPESEILNFGVSGTGTDQELLQYRQQGAQYSPDLVVLGFYVKCAKRNGELAIRTPRGWRPKPRFELQHGSLVLTHVPVPDSLIADPEDLESLDREKGTAAFAKRFLKRHSRLYVFLRDNVRGKISRGESTKYPEYHATSPEWQVTAAIITEMAHEVRANGSRFAVAFFPSLEEMDRESSTEPRDQIRNLCSKLDVPFLDLLPTFLEAHDAALENGTPLYFPIDRHWTADGHALAAREMLPWVKALARTPVARAS